MQLAGLSGDEASCQRGSRLCADSVHHEWRAVKRIGKSRMGELVLKVPAGWDNAPRDLASNPQLNH